MPAWLSIPLYMGSIGIILWGGWLLTRVVHQRRLRAKGEYADGVQRDLVLHRMGQTPRRYARPPHDNASPLLRGDWRA